MQYVSVRTSRRAHLLAISITLGLSAAADAQTSAAKMPVEDVVTLTPFEVKAPEDRGYIAANSVSATRIATPIRETPFTVNVLTNQFLQDTAGSNLQDVARYATGVRASRDNTSDNVNYVIRGFEQNETLRDGVRRGGPNDPAGIERVEVIKGPASLLYGAINPAGVVNYLSKRPSEKSEATFSQTLGSWNYSRTVLDATGPLGTTGNVYYRTVAAYTTTDSFRVLQNDQTLYFAPTLLLKPLPSVRIDLGLEHMRRAGLPGYGIPGARTSPTAMFNRFADVPRSFNPNTEENFSDDAADVISGAWTQQLGTHTTLRASANYLRRTQNRFFYTRGAATGVADNPAFLELGRQTQAYDLAENVFVSQLDVTNRLTFDRHSINTVVGLEYRDTFSRNNFRQVNGPTSPAGAGNVPPSWNLNAPSTWDRSRRLFSLLTPVSHAFTERTDEAAYALLQMNFWDRRVTSVGGVRYDRMSEGVSGDYFLQTNSAIVQPNQTSPQVGVLGKLTNEIAAYASYSTSFVPNNGFGRRLDGTLFPYVPTTGTGYEAGFKFDLFSGRLSGTLSYFDIEQSNRPASIGGVDMFGNNVTYNVQTGADESKGVELDAVWSPIRNLTVLFGYTQAAARIKSSQDLPALEGAELARAPRHMANVWTKYEFSQGSLEGLWLAAGALYWSDRIYQPGVRGIIIPSAIVANLAGGYATQLFDRPVEFQVNIENVFDKFYIVGDADVGTPLSVRFSVRTRF